MAVLAVSDAEPGVATVVIVPAVSVTVKVYEVPGVRPVTTQVCVEGTPTLSAFV